MNKEYKDYKDLDYDFPDTSNIINEYLGCQASTNEGKKCEIPAEFGGYKNKNKTCENYCYKHINKWYQKIFDMKLKTFDNLYYVKAERILITYKLISKHNNLNMFMENNKFLAIMPTEINEYDNFTYKLKKKIITNDTSDEDKQCFWNFLITYYYITNITIFYDLINKDINYLIDNYSSNYSSNNNNILITPENTQISGVILMSRPGMIAKHVFTSNINDEELN